MNEILAHQQIKPVVSGKAGTRAAGNPAELGPHATENARKLWELQEQRGAEATA